MAKEILIETGKKAGGKLFSPAFLWDSTFLKFWSSKYIEIPRRLLFTAENAEETWKTTEIGLTK